MAASGAGNGRPSTAQARRRSLGHTPPHEPPTSRTEQPWQGNGQSSASNTVRAITRDGRYVAFLSFATNLVPSDTNGVYDAFVRDRVAGTTERISLSWDNNQSNNSTYGQPALSGDGHFVAFESLATSLVPNDTNGQEDIFVRTR